MPKSVALKRENKKDEGYNFVYSKPLASLSENEIERIRDELLKTLLTDQSKKGLRLFAELGIFDWLIPELQDCVGFEQNKFHKHDVFEHTLDVVENIPKSKLLRLSALFHDIGKPPSLSVSEDGERHFYLHEKIGADMVDIILPRLRFSNSDTNAVKVLVATHMRPLNCGDGGLRRILRDTGEYYDDWRQLKFADTVAVLGEEQGVINEFNDFDDRIEKVKTAKKPHPFSSLSITGQDLIELGLTPSRKFKDILAYLQEAVLDDPDINTKESLLKLVRDKFIV
jgi:tRNA nucleotidyltransferase (CCA-adding enzyme)